MCKMHRVRYIKGIKIFESMFKPKSTVVSNKTDKYNFSTSTRFSISIQTNVTMLNKILSEKCTLSFLYLVKGSK